MSENATTLLVVDDEPSIADALAAMLRAPSRTVVVAYDVDAAEMAAERFALTHVIADIQFSRFLGFEGIRLLDRLLAHRPAARIVTMTGYPSRTLRAAATARGVAGFVEKPCAIADLRDALGLPEDEVEGAGNLLRIPPVEELIASITPYFQPIVSIGSGAIFGFEALARIEGGWALETPQALFEYASRQKRIVELNRACIERALAAARELPESARIFVNVDGPALCAAGFIDSFDSAPVDLSRVVVEISESFAIHDEGRAYEAVAALRRRGIAVAFDDIGEAYSHFPLIAGIQPEFVKISHRMGSGFERNASQRRLLAGIVAFAGAIGSTVVLEGIETPATAAAAHQLGIELVQGYWFGRPSRVEEWSVDRDKPAAHGAAGHDPARLSLPSLALIAS
ncbi:MAG TPA: EAL domain-containing response regulator [Thermoanaerobaculia bacterium]